LTLAIIAGLVIQAAAVCVMHVGIRGQWMRHVGAIFLGAAVAYHGITEIMQAAFPGTRYSYRPMIQQANLDRWLLLVSIALLGYAAAYSVIWRKSSGGRAVDDVSDGSPRPGYFRNLNAWWMIAPTAPLLYFTATGSGGTGLFSGEERTGAEYVISGLATQYLILLTAIAGAVIVAKHGVRWLLPTLLVESCLLSLVGSRWSIILGCVITVYALRIADIRLPRKTLMAGVSIAVTLILTLSASRAVLGRDSFWAGSGASARTEALMAGGVALGSTPGWEGIKNDTIYRLDGNSFGVLVDQSISAGVPTVGMATMRGNIRALLPSFLFPGKNDAALEVRNEEVFIQRHFGFGSTRDFLPGVLGSVIAYYGELGMLIIAVLLGVLFAAIDVLIRRRRNPIALVFGCAVVLPSLMYEQGPPAFLVAARGAVVLAVLVWFCLRLPRTNSGADGRSRLKADLRPA
jgi:hypothetical protein